MILFSEDEGTGYGFHTRGMRKFGRPDISIRHVPAESRQAAIELCNRFIAYQAFGAMIPEGEEIRTQGLPRECVAAMLEASMTRLHNVHVEIEHPG